MSKKPETTFYTSVHKHLTPKLHKEKMFNPYSGGTWDFWYSGKKRDLWVEYKFLILPKRESTPIVVTLSPLQIEWGKRRLAEGRNIAVIVGCKEGGVILENFSWLDTLTCTEFKNLICSRAEIAQWLFNQTGGPP
jgi:hypothetical protein